MIRFAIFLESISFKHLDPYVRRVYLFEREEDVITAIGDELLTLYDLHYLLLWLLGKRVEQIYVNDIDEQVKEQIKKLDISINELKEVKDNPLLKAILWPEKYEK